MFFVFFALCRLRDESYLRIARNPLDVYMIGAIGSAHAIEGYAYFE
jgi:hypothetical protein